jgi:hypothetical protein
MKNPYEAYRNAGELLSRVSIALGFGELSMRFSSSGSRFEFLWHVSLGKKGKGLAQYGMDERCLADMRNCSMDAFVDHMVSGLKRQLKDHQNDLVRGSLEHIKEQSGIQLEEKDLIHVKFSS